MIICSCNVISDHEVRETVVSADVDLRSTAHVFTCLGCFAVVREIGLPEDIVNVEGGAIAHGHPIGATGAILTTRLIYSMRRDGLRRGVVTLCIGGGQGMALAIEIHH